MLVGEIEALDVLVSAVIVALLSVFANCLISNWHFFLPEDSISEPFSHSAL
jgi:hypothetical protein